jgi:hypothetical protein
MHVTFTNGEGLAKESIFSDANGRRKVVNVITLMQK